MDVQAFFPARFAEQVDGLLNVLGGGLGQVPVQAFPFTFQTLAVVIKILLDREDNQIDHIMQIKLRGADNEFIFEAGPFDIPARHIPEGDAFDFMKVNAVIILTNVMFTGPGRCWFELYYDRTLVKKSPMRLELVTNPTDTVAQTQEG